jgi:penicillin-binding protein 1A
MVSAYSTIATAGEYRRPLFVKRITDRHGKLLAEFENEGRRAMTEDTALELIDMMRGVINRGTGTVIKTRFGIVADIAGKTGTTQNNTDGWFILMHPNLVAGAWVGFNDARVTMRSTYWGQGGHNAALVIGDFFRDTLKANLLDPTARFPLPRRYEMIARSGTDVTMSEGGSGIDAGLPPGTGVIVRGDGTRVVIGTPTATPSGTRNAPPPAAPASSHPAWQNNTLFEPNHN